MEQRLKQRLVGAVVLVALGVIFIPMLLTGPVQHTRVDVPIEIPPRPESSQTPQAPAQGFANEPSPGRELAGEPQPADAAATPAQHQPKAEAERRAAAENPTSDTDDTGAEGEAGVDSQGTAASGGEAPAVAESSPSASDAEGESGGGNAAGESTPTDQLSSWAVQVGAFRGRDNALSFRDRLREAGFSVYVDRIQSQDAPLYRVRVGPVAARDEAETLVRQLKSGQDLKGIVVEK